MRQIVLTKRRSEYQKMVSLDDIWIQSGFIEHQTDPPSVSVLEASYGQYICTCGGIKVFPPNDLPVCSSCGVADFEFISEEAEWTSGIDNDGNVNDASRCGGPVDSQFFSAGWGMGTKITTRFGHPNKMSRIHFHMSMNHKDRALFHAYAEIERIAREKLGCSDTIIDTAKTIYKEFSEKKLTRGEVRKGVKANCVFLACKKHGYPRTTKEIATAFDMDTKDIGRTSAILKDTISEKKSQNITMPKDVIVRIFEHIDVENKSKRMRQCIKVCESIEKSSKLMGKTPSGVASAVIYVVLGDAVSKQDICESASISIPTLNKIECAVRELILHINK